MEDQSRLRRSANAVGSGNGGLRLDGGQFRVGPGRKVGLKSVLDHGGVRRGNQIEMKRMIGMHQEIVLLWTRNASLTRRGAEQQVAGQQVSESASQHLAHHCEGRRGTTIKVPFKESKARAYKTCSWLAQ